MRTDLSLWPEKKRFSYLRLLRLQPKKSPGIGVRGRVIQVKYRVIIERNRNFFYLPRVEPEGVQPGHGGPESPQLGEDGLDDVAAELPAVAHKVEESLRAFGAAILRQSGTT